MILRPPLCFITLRWRQIEAIRWLFDQLDARLQTPALDEAVALTPLPAPG